MTTFKKIIFWVVAGLSLAMLVLSIFYSAKPEWFAGIVDMFGWDEATVNAVLTTLGFGGTIGTTGFSVILATLSKSLAAGTKLSASTIKMVEDTTLSIIKDNKENYQTLANQVREQAKANGLLAENQKINTESINALLLMLTNLIDLEIININKTLNNPLVDEKTKEALKKGLEALDLKPIEEPEIPIEKE